MGVPPRRYREWLIQLLNSADIKRCQFDKYIHPEFQSTESALPYCQIIPREKKINLTEILTMINFNKVKDADEFYDLVKLVFKNALTYYAKFNDDVAKENKKVANSS